MTADMEQAWMSFEQKRDVSCRNHLVECYMPIVRETAVKMLNLLRGTVELDDLEGAGTVGLIDAIGRYRRSHGVRFETFCRPRIRGAMVDELRLMDRFSRCLRVKIQRLERAAEQLRCRLRRPAFEHELAEYAGLPLPDVLTLLRRKDISVFSLDSLHVSRTSGEEANPLEMVPDERGVDPMKTAQTNDLTERAVSLLSAVERKVVMLYYFDQLTMREIGELLELTESRVCQIHTRVKKRLRRLLS